RAREADVALDVSPLLRRAEEPSHDARRQRRAGGDVTRDRAPMVAVAKRTWGHDESFHGPLFVGRTGRYGRRTRTFREDASIRSSRPYSVVCALASSIRRDASRSAATRDANRSSRHCRPCGRLAPRARGVAGGGGLTAFRAFYMVSYMVWATPLRARRA